MLTALRQPPLLMPFLSPVQPRVPRLLFPCFLFLVSSFATSSHSFSALTVRFINPPFCPVFGDKIRDMRVRDSRANEILLLMNLSEMLLLIINHVH